MSKGKKPGDNRGNDPIVKFVKFMSWGKVSQLHNTTGSHRLVVNWIDSVLPWFRSYYEAVYAVPLTDLRLLNIVSTLSARYSTWPDCERVRNYKYKAELPLFLDRSPILVEDICAVIGYAPVATPQEPEVLNDQEFAPDDECHPAPMTPIPEITEGDPPTA